MQSSPLVEDFGYFVPASTWDNFATSPAQNALQFAPANSPLSSSSFPLSSTMMAFAEQPSSSRMTMPSNAPFHLPPARPISDSSNYAYAQSYGYNVQPYPSPSIQVHPMNAPRSVAPSRSTSPASPGSSLPSPGGRTPRVVSLHRGEACLHCRKRKMRCDAMKPSCGPCMTNGKECEYEISPYLRQIQQLQDEVAMLRARMAEIEGRSPPSSPSSVSPLSLQSHMDLILQQSPGVYPLSADLQHNVHAYAGYTPFAQQQNHIW